MSTEIVLIRHGQSTANAEGVWQGRLDFPLSELGREQARHAGEALAGDGIEAVYTSPLSRARQTAEIVSRKTREGDVEALGGLAERSGGLLEDTTPEQRASEMPELMQKFRVLPDEERWRLVGAETDEEVLGRFEEALSDILGRHREIGEKVVIVSHGGAVRAFLRSRFGTGVLPDDERVPNASITRLLVEEDGEARLLELASTAHLPQETRGPAE